MRGREFSLFYFLQIMLPETVENRLRQIIKDTNPEIYVVDISLHRSKRSIISVLIDTDSGIVLSEITAVNRAISKYIDTEDPLDFAFNLEVGSPGVGRPLILERQYHRHIGRDLKVKTKEGALLKGRLISVEDSKGIVLKAAVSGKVDKKNVAPGGESPGNFIPFSDIQEAIVTISFN